MIESIERDPDEPWVDKYSPHSQVNFSIHTITMIFSLSITVKFSELEDVILGQVVTDISSYQFYEHKNINLHL